MTKKEALQITADLWKWLYEHPSKEKYDWPRWEWKGGEVRECLSCCPLCEYAKIEGTYRVDCCHCLLQWTSKDESIIKIGFQPCMNRTASFAKWDDAKSPKTKKKYAKIIYEAALEELEALT